MDKISAVIITSNEERNIGRCIDSLLNIVDEIIVVDALSTDNTKKICKERDVRFIQKKWMGYTKTKNFANNLASNKYIYSIDADEALSNELKRSILVAKENGLDGIYSHNRLTNYCGDWIKYIGWYPDKKIRLFPKNTVKWQGEFVHEELVFKKDLKEHFLKGDLLHFSYYSKKEHQEKADKYSILKAKRLNAINRKTHFLKPYFSAVTRFISMYILKLGFLEGRSGYEISKISAKSNILKYKELIRLNKKSEQNNIKSY